MASEEEEEVPTSGTLQKELDIRLELAGLREVVVRSGDRPDP